MTSDRLRATELHTDIGFLLARASARANAAANRALAPLDLKVRSYSVLAIAASTIPASQRELASLLELDPSQVVALVDALEEKGLVERQPDSSDRRVKIVVATPSGRALFEQAREATTGAERFAYGRIEEADRIRLRLLLQMTFGDEGAEELVAAVPAARSR
ncbi:DNA-binding MarR family transcriptional regulator [Homoserinimonas aerilata]|uniref:DNA-binding MarR family transcriptional regulator n=1 Tax=Homoserinimonas aerilata TaxID=1162970 RepID=A0A542YHJ2_9MICO|nr:MarR family transcriptional regulator [Homoserinimonas aerilata]TQL47536.1 DNA-binding MarR family transcriptional regulator [Homoserinimonas aerilata]